MDIPIIGQMVQLGDEPATSSSSPVPVNQACSEVSITEAVEEDSNDDEDQAGPLWGDLPDICITLIASNLLPWDKSKMGMTCRNWNRVIMSTPQLWRSAEMRFRGSYRDTDHVLYAKAVGRYLKNLYIYGGIRLGRRASRFQRTFTAMLQNLYRQGPVQLNQLSVTEMQFQHQFRGDGVSGGNTARAGVVRSLSRFLRAQTKLEELDLSYGTLSRDEGVNLVQAAAERSRDKLKYLTMDDMFDRNAHISFGPDFANAMGRFQNLVDLTLNYGYVTDLLLTKLGESCRKSLEYIYIRTHRCDSFQHTIDVSSWHGIRQKIPRLRVKFTLNGIMKLNDIQRLLATSIPLESVHIFGHNDDGFHPNRTAKHLARHYRDTLRKAVIDVGPVYRTYSEGLTTLITDCPSLRYLEIHGRVSWPTLRELFEYIDEEYLKKNLTPSLKDLKIVITCVGQEEPEAQMLVMEEFRSNFESHNLNYDVIVDPIYPIPLLDPNPNLMAVFW